MVLVDRPLTQKHPDHGVVHSDNYAGGRQLAEHLLKKGHRKFACLSVPTEHIPSIECRIKGFEEFLIENGVKKEAIDKVVGELNYESGYALMNKILSDEDRPTAVFACSDIMAWGALEAVKKTTLRIPEDIAICGYDNIYFSEIIEPNLTTVNQMKHMSGVVAMSILLDYENIERLGLSMQNNTIILETELVERETT
jgi:DNA-binding LacI/PurR family transcriptional regulator